MDTWTDPHQPQTLGPSDQTCQILVAASRTHVARGFEVSRTLRPWLALARPRSWPRQTTGMGNEQLITTSASSATSLEPNVPPPRQTRVQSPTVPRRTEIPLDAGRSPSLGSQSQSQSKASPAKALEHLHVRTAHALRLQYLPDTYTLMRPSDRGPCHGTAATRRLGISCLHACPHTRGKSGCERANSYCSARLTLMLTPTLTPTLTEPGSLPQPSPSKRLSRAQTSCR